MEGRVDVTSLVSCITPMASFSILTVAGSLHLVYEPATRSDLLQWRWLVKASADKSQEAVLMGALMRQNSRQSQSPSLAWVCHLLSSSIRAKTQVACRLPGEINNPSALWRLLREGRSGRRDIPRSRFNFHGFLAREEVNGESDNHQGYFLQEDIRNFDPDFFGILPSEATYMDPQQRKLLEVVYECFESAGVRLDQVSGSETGCYIGNFTYDFAVMQTKDPDSLHRYSATGMGSTILSNRISHTFNMFGPR